jgi:hypothetical protein
MIEGFVNAHAIRKILLLSALAFCFDHQAFCQNHSLSVAKENCRFMKKYYGAKLVMKHKTDTIHESSKYGYGLDYFINLGDSIKLLLIEHLLKYEDDITLCCLDVVEHSLNGNEGCRGAPKNVRRYTIQVDALLMINRLCWPKLIELYSCVPVLYDNKEKQQINNNPKLIKIVFEDYKKWHAECKATGKIPRYFPFNDGRYVWYGGRKSIAAKH